ncbi:Cation/H+ exchanger [Artemisia annua]|uniref:Cation/H+ exchanger n=1 Tax=Artemisia annua TaxID=35608 RepID=A0A2U1KGX0_ARTAN|nr:Cation/H+ exchanger [Artemisia annua]
MDGFYGISNSNVHKRNALSPITNLPPPDPYYNQKVPVVDPYASPDGHTSGSENMSSPFLRYIQSARTLFSPPLSAGDYPALAEYKFHRSSGNRSSVGSSRMELLPCQSRSLVVFYSWVGQMSQVLANFLSTPLATGIDGEAGWPFVAFDLDPSIVKESSKLGFPIRYGDGSRAAVLQSAGISSPKAVIVMYEGRKRAVEAVERIQLAFPAVIFFGLLQTSLQLGSKLLKGLGVMSDDVNFLSHLVRDSMELQAQTSIVPRDPDPDAMKPLHVAYLCAVLCLSL